MNILNIFPNASLDLDVAEFRRHHHDQVYRSQEEGNSMACRYYVIICIYRRFERIRLLVVYIK